MFGKASSSQQSTLSGSGTLSHVYIQFPPLRCSRSGSSNLFYDDGSKLLLAATSNQVFSWKTTPFDPHVVPSSISISEGPVLSIRYSLDSKLLAIQRSDHDVQIWNREGAEIGTYKCRSEAEIILGFFWTDSSTSDIVIVNTSGLVFLSCKAETKSLTIVDTKKVLSAGMFTHMQVGWYFLPQACNARASQGIMYDFQHIMSKLCIFWSSFWVVDVVVGFCMTKFL